MEASLELTVLGAGAALPAVGRGPACYALCGGGLAGVTLMDCGPGSIRSLADHGIDLLDLRRVLVSHFHTDHVLDLFHLAFARRSPFLDRELPELELIGSVGLDALLHGRRPPLDSWDRDGAHRVTEVEPQQAGRLARPDGTFRWRGMRHSTEAVAWRVEAPSGATVVYSGDTGESPGLARLVAEGGGADLLVCECALAEGDEPDMHMTGAAAGRAARDGGARSLLLSHFYPHCDPEAARAAAATVFDGPVLVAVDGTRLCLEPGRPAIRTGSR